MELKIISIRQFLKLKLPKKTSKSFVLKQKSMALNLFVSILAMHH